MVEVTLHYDRNNRVSSFTVEGHAGYAAYGKDIVCAAVSVLAQTAIIGLEYFLEPKPEVVIKNGFLSCRLPEEMSDRERIQAEAIVGTLALGLESTRNQYPEHMRILKRRCAPCG